MTKLNIFEKFREYQSRKVDNPNYEPLEQKILDKNDIMRIIDREEIRKAKKREYNKKYNANRSEEQKARDRELRRKYYEEHKDDHKIPEKAQKAIRQRLRDPNEPTGLQIMVYNYMLEKYKETGNIPRAQQIARDFGKTDASIYSVMALLVKKGKLYKGARGQLYFTSHYEYNKPDMVYTKENSKKKYDTLVIHIDGGLGRVVAMSGAITELAKKRPVKVVTSRPLVFRGNPYIKSVHGLDDRRLFEDVIKGNDYVELEPYTDPEFFNEGKNWLHIAAKKLGEYCDGLDELEIQPCLFLAEHEKIGNTLDGEKPILFQPFGSSMGINGVDKSYRSILVNQAQYIANELIKKGYTVYEVIKPHEQPILEGCRILDTPDMRFVVSLCDKYPVVGCDSSLHHCAKAFGKKALVVWAGTDVERYGYESSINMREYPMVAHTPLRLGMNDFNFDISNQYTNQFSKEFLDEVIKNVDSLYE